MTHSTDTNTAGELRDDGLLPCPFCGGTDVDNYSDPRWLRCGTCDAEGPYAATPDEGRALWNARTSRPTPPSCEVDGLRKALEIIARKISPTFGRPHTMSGGEAAEIARQALSSSAGGGGKAGNAERHSYKNPRSLNFTEKLEDIRAVSASPPDKDAQGADADDMRTAVTDAITRARTQNWKNGGVHTYDADELIESLLRDIDRIRPRARSAGVTVDDAMVERHARFLHTEARRNTASGGRGLPEWDKELPEYRARMLTQSRSALLAALQQGEE